MSNQTELFTQSKMAHPQAYATFLLVHGAFHGAWCWDRVASLLRERGHQVEAVELSDAADKGTSPDALMSSWANHVAERIRSCATPVLLVGHSRSGLIVSQAAEIVPECITMAVYCAAYLVDHGETIADVRARLREDSRSLLRIERSPGSDLLALDPSSAAEAIYSCSPAQEVALIVANLSLEPSAGFAIAPRLTSKRYGSVPRGAIECLQDRVLPISFQREMRKSQPCQAIVSLDCDNAPFVSDPEGLAAALIEFAEWPPG